MVVQDGKLDRWEGLYGKSIALTFNPVGKCYTNFQIKISEWILLIACYVFVGLRVYTRMFVQRQKLRLSEYVLIISAVDALGLIICEYDILKLRPTTETSADKNETVR